MKVYLAGPDVFRPDARAWFETAKAWCAAAGCEGLSPLDGEATSAGAIYAHNVALIRSADAVVANLNAFRGAEPDSGTCFEVGFALALGKKVIGYVDDPVSIKERVARWQGAPLHARENAHVDCDGLIVEDFGLPLNLMLAIPAHVVVGGLQQALAALRD